MLIIFIIITILFSGLAFLIRKHQISYFIVTAYCLFLGGFSSYELLHMGERQWNYLNPDALGVIFLFILSVLSFITSIQYRLYALRRKEDSRTVAIHNGVFIVFLAAITGVNLSNNFGLMWAFIEATTLTGAVLIYHDREKLVLEAVWKYIFVCSVSIALAFAGILFLSIAAQESNSVDFSFEGISRLTTTMNPIWLKACFLFVLTGFSVKMGVFPMFNVDIDAKDMAPSPISAMFSSVLMNTGFLAIFRFYAAFSGTDIQPWMHHVLMITGILSILLAAAYLIRVKNYKRIFGYSSMEHAGLILLAVSMGKAGCFAAVLHIILHSLIKSSLFYQIGQVHYWYESKMDGIAGGYFKKNPAGGLVLLIGLFSAIALPPSGLFFSEFLIFKSFIAEGQILLCVVVMLLLTVIMYSLSKSILRLLFISPPSTLDQDQNRISPWESTSQFILLGLSIYLGFAQPPFFVDFINQALVAIQ
ncbi:MAG: hydrogenase-4 component F [Cyclobacteriaceae bacterium]|jgi:hydrogenase-4 component F